MAATHVRTTNAVSSTEPTRLVPTRFRIKHAALSAFLVVRGAQGGTQICAQMDRIDDDDDQWELTLRLPPGQYHYRYYAIHERVTTYVSPSDVEERPVRMHGLDAILTVRASPGTVVR